MAGLAALRSGAGLVTVSCSAPDLTAVAPELMTEALPPADSLGTLVLRKNVVAIGPGLGVSSTAQALVRRAYLSLDQPLVVDADGLNVLSEGEWPISESLRVLTPHPGEMSRLSGIGVREILRERTTIARRFAIERSCVLILKGERTLIAFPDGRVWINPTGTPAMATGGSGDILTGMLAGFLAQFPNDTDNAIAGAVYLHGLSGEIGAEETGELPLTATDLLRYLPQAIHDSIAN
jgi:NAD(P)H-hydrate epimerase